MKTTLGDLAKLVDGRLIGDGDTEMTGAATLGTAGPTEISLLDHKDKAHRLRGAEAGALIAPLDFEAETLPCIQVEQVHDAFAKIVCHFRPPRQRRRIGVAPEATVSPSAQLGNDVDIYPGATIGDDVVIGAGTTIHRGVQIMAGCQIGENVIIFPNAVLYDDTVVGNECILHAGAVLGAYGFGYASDAQGHHLSHQLGYVELGNQVEVGANSCIDRGTYGPTVIGNGTKIDNMVQIAHNCQIGEHNLICALVGFAGSGTTGDFVTMAGQVGLRDHIKIGSRSVLGAQAGVSHDLPEDSFCIGSPAVPARDFKRILAAQMKLPETRKQFRELQRIVAELSLRTEALSDATLGEKPQSHKPSEAA